MKRQAVAIVAGVITAFCSQWVHAEWPERSITLVVPYPAVGNSDIIARITAEWLGKALKQSIVVENRGGAGGAIAAEYVARAPANGYILFNSASAVSTIIPHLQKVNFDPFKSFAPISIVGTNAIAFAVNASVPVKTLAEFVDYAKARPGQLNYTAGAAGGIGHLTMALFLKRAGLAMPHVAYKGGAPAMADVLGGRVPIILTNVAEVLPYYKSGKLKILAVSSEKRGSQLPEIPTVAEQGYPGFATGTWNGLAAPAGTPKDVIAKIARAISPACKDAAFDAKFHEVGVDALCTTPEQFAQRLRADWTMWGEAVKLSGVAVQ